MQFSKSDNNNLNSSQLIHLAFEGIVTANAVFVLNEPNIILTSCNKEFQELFSEKPDIKEGDEITTIFKKDVALWRNAFNKIFRSGEPGTLRLNIESKTENYIAKCFLTDKKRIEVFIHHDFKKNPHSGRLNENNAIPENIYRLIFENSRIAKGYFDLNGRLLLINEKAAEILGKKPEQLIGRTLKELSTKEVAAIIEQRFKKVIDSGTETTFETDIQDFPENIWMKSTYQPVYDNSEKMVGILLSSGDVSDLKITETISFKSEALFRTIFEMAALGISLVNSSGDITRVNQKFADILGYSSDELLGKNFRDFTYPADLPANEEKIDLINTGSTNSLFIEKRYIHKTGRIIWVNIYSAVLRDADGKWDYSVNVINDITEQKFTQDEIKWQKTLLETTFDSISDGLIITNPKRIIMICNKGVKLTYGYEPDELIGKSIEIVYANKEDFIRIGKEHFIPDLSEEKRIFQAEFRRKDGTTFFGETIGMRLYSKNGEYMGNFGITRDITERENLMKELLNAKEKAEESDRLKSAFLANMSHEIRTPMNGIIGFSELLKEPDISEDEKNNFISIIHDSSHQLLNIVNDIIDISKIEAGQIEINESKLALNDLLDEICSFFNTNAIQNEIKLKVNKGLSDSDSNILTDTIKLHQVLNNLVSNAIKFTSNGYVEVGYHLKESNLEFYVKDTGIGISKDHHKTIFERFRQVDNSISRTHGGTGLGLSISSAFVIKMGGNMWVESETGKGSVFYFTIPYKPDPEISGVKKDQTLKLNNKVDILIVEDNETNFSFLRAALEQPNINITHAISGEDAIEICKNKNDIHLVLMDIKLPGIDGYKATAEIKKIKPDLPIIAQTAYAMSGDENLALAAGCDGYLTKPVTLNDLQKTLNKFLG